MATDVRNLIVQWAKEGVIDEETRQEFDYLEVRPLSFSWNPPIRTDCSFFCLLVYKKAGVTDDPSGCNWSGYGNSDSLWNHGTHISQSELLPGDVITFGPGGSVHAVICVTIGADPVCASMGRQGDPSLVALSVLESLGEATFLRFNTTDEAAPTPWSHALTLSELKKAQLIHLLNPADAILARANHWTVFIWNGYNFVPSVGPHGVDVKEYANVHYKSKRP
jgi:hypothetical protein